MSSARAAVAPPFGGQCRCARGGDCLGALARTDFITCGSATGRSSSTAWFYMCRFCARLFVCGFVLCVCVDFCVRLIVRGGVRRFVCAEQLLIVCGWSLCALRTRQCARVIIVCVVQALCAVNVCGNANAFVCIYCVRHCVQASWAALCACIVCNALCANRVNNEPSCC